MQRHAFTSTALFLWSGLLIWAADFLFVYVFAALACARSFAHLKFFGIGVVPLVTTASSILAGLLTAAVMWRAVRSLRREPEADEHSKFILFVGVAGGALALVALLWLAIPPLVVAAICG